MSARSPVAAAQRHFADREHVAAEEEARHAARDILRGESGASAKHGGDSGRLAASHQTRMKRERIKASAPLSSVILRRIKASAPIGRKCDSRPMRPESRPCHCGGMDRAGVEEEGAAGRRCVAGGDLWRGRSGAMATAVRHCRGRRLRRGRDIAAADEGELAALAAPRRKWSSSRSGPRLGAVDDHVGDGELAGQRLAVGFPIERRGPGNRSPRRRACRRGGIIDDQGFGEAAAARLARSFVALPAHRRMLLRQ